MFIQLDEQTDGLHSTVTTIEEARFGQNMSGCLGSSTEERPNVILDFRASFQGKPKHVRTSCTSRSAATFTARIIIIKKGYLGVPVTFELLQTHFRFSCVPRPSRTYVRVDPLF